MDFRTKDLLVTVLPKAEAGDLAKVCLLHTWVCLRPSLCARPSLCGWPSICHNCSVLISCLGGCSALISQGCGLFRSCGPGGSACDPTIFCAGSDPYVVADREDLVALRGELQETLKRLDEIEKAGLPSGIGSRSEAEQIERSLSEALEQVRAIKKEMK